MFLNDSELQAIWLTVRLAGIVTLILLLVGTPIAWWKGRIAAVVGLPLVAATFGTQPLVNSRATTIQRSAAEHGLAPGMTVWV